MIPRIQYMAALTGDLSRAHVTHAHSAEADVATASRQQSMATTMHGQRLVIDFGPLLPSVRTTRVHAS